MTIVTSMKSMMKCNKCGEEWATPPGKSVKFCPFCSEPIQIFSTEISSDNVIKALVLEFGENILLESRLFSLVADKLQNKAPQLQKRIRLAINENIPQRLFDLKPANEQEREMKINVMAAALADDYGMKATAAYEIIHYFADSLGYKLATLPSAMPRTSAVKAAPKIGSIISFGNYNWRVLDVQGDKVLLLTEDVIEERKYNMYRTDITWEACTLRKYLNGEFLQKFTREEQGRIIETRAFNPNNLWYGTHGGRDTDDKVFLLSLEEVDRYFGNSGDYHGKRRKKYNDGKWVTASDGYGFSNFHNTGRVAKYESKAWWWWLRSPGGSSNSAAYVHDGGSVYVSGLYVLNYNGGVRPALWLNL